MKSHDAREWLQITDHPEALENARQQALASQGTRVRRLMDQPEEAWYDGNYEHSLKRHASTLIPAWREIVVSDAQSFERRLFAARFLCELRDGAGLDFLIDSLRTGKGETPHKALGEIWSLACWEGGAALPWISRKADLLRTVLMERFTVKNESLFGMITGLEPKLGLPGAAERAIELWEATLHPVSRRRLLELFPAEARTAGRFTAIERGFTDGAEDEFALSELLLCCAAFLASPDRAVVQRALAAIEEFFPWKRKELTREDEGALSTWYPIIEDTATFGGHAAVPLLEHFLRSRLNGSYRGIALKSLAKVVGPGIFTYIDEVIDQPRLAPDIADALASVFVGTGNADAISRLQTLAQRARGEFPRERIAMAIKSIGGPDAKKVARKQLRDFPRHVRQTLQAAAAPTSLPAIGARLVELGLASPFSGDEFRAMQEREKVAEDDPAWSLLLMTYANARVTFDTESMDSTARHDELIQEFADNSRGRFRPEIIVQAKRKRNAKTVSVQFVSNGRLYGFEARATGDSYDLERTVLAIHRSLADAGIAERFLARDTGDQIADFVFGDPSAIAQAAHEFEWALDDATNLAFSVSEKCP